MNIHRMMANSISSIWKTAARFYLGNRTGRAFVRRIAPQMQQSAALREQQEKEGLHVPPFLIASIASQCNLRCAGCYARAGGVCCETGNRSELSTQDWARIFAEAEEIGVSFILLAGGEPLMRRDVLRAAAEQTDMVFPFFTNGTLMDEEILSLLNRHRNLIPVLSLEGNRQQTDARRGAGVYDRIAAGMDMLQRNKILFGVSITVTRQNRESVLCPAFLAALRRQGSGLVIFVEYVPVEENTRQLALDETERLWVTQRAGEIKRRFKDMVVLSFPGDEASMGGCLASGRGFFHINSVGGAEPCPFSPYAKYNLMDTSMRQVLQSDYFRDLQAVAAGAGPHTGGCVLFEKKAEVQALHDE